MSDDTEFDCGAGDAIRALLTKLPPTMSYDRRQALNRAVTALLNYGWGSVYGEYVLAPIEPEELIQRERLFRQ